MRAHATPAQPTTKMTTFHAQERDLQSHATHPDFGWEVTAGSTAEATTATGAQAAAAGDIPSAVGDNANQRHHSFHQAAMSTLAATQPAVRNHPLACNPQTFLGTSYPPLAVGSLVLARYRASDTSLELRQTSWYEGTVTAANTDGSCDVQYFDGHFEPRVSRRFMRPHTAPLRLAPHLSDGRSNSDWLYGRVHGRLTSEQHGLLNTVLVHREWLKDQLTNAPALGVPGVGEVYYCRRHWRNHFNGDASRPHVRVIEDVSDDSRAFALAAEELSRSLSSHVAPAVGRFFHGRVARFIQPGFSSPESASQPVFRDWHPDSDRSGDYILTVTIEGDCTIEVGCYELDGRQRELQCWRVHQSEGSYYMIHGPSLAPVRHRVLRGTTASRLSLTFRYIDGEPRVPVDLDAASSDTHAARGRKRAVARAKQQDAAKR
ncbi:tudor domain-containing protein [bacterium]|nr:tudor domain-containing protein [bacterium]